jgi:8-oxo-dGTP pyrophosphatase MutT (NUDIX family)
MFLVFSDDAFPTRVTKSIFLAGPSPRTLAEVDSRHEALAVLRAKNFDGTVFIPVPRERFLNNSSDKSSWSYDNQIAWECEARERVDLVVFWLAREIDRSKPELGMPGFTTNFELGEDLHAGKVVYGRPTSAPKCRYMDKRVEALGLKVHESLDSLLTEAIERLGEGAERVDGEVFVPLFIWKTPQFQTWYSALKEAGNRLEHARVGHHVRFGEKYVFSYLLWVKVWVESEQRLKANEFVFARPDISSVVAYCFGPEKAIRFALVREFRSSVNNPEGYVYEAPGGSSAKPGVDPLANASHELAEELGLTISDMSRFRHVNSRQLVATLSTHKVGVYAIELTQDEFAQLEQASLENKSFGVAEDSERTHVQVVNLEDLFKLPLDYATLGMLFEAIREHL